jgi:MSHA biogenesis protein MshP
LIGTKAWFLANSGVEWALTQLYPLNESSLTEELEIRCNQLQPSSSVAMSYLISQVDINCRSLSVQCETVNGGDLKLIPKQLSYFKITSTAICGDGQGFDIQRQQEAWVKGLSQ